MRLKLSGLLFKHEQSVLPLRLAWLMV